MPLYTRRASPKKLGKIVAFRHHARAGPAGPEVVPLCGMLFFVVPRLALLEGVSLTRGAAVAVGRAPKDVPTAGTNDLIIYGPFQSDLPICAVSIYIL